VSLISGDIRSRDHGDSSVEKISHHPKSPQYSNLSLCLELFLSANPTFSLNLSETLFSPSENCFSMTRQTSQAIKWAPVWLIEVINKGEVKARSRIKGLTQAKGTLYDGIDGLFDPSGFCATKAEIRIELPFRPLH
jgi:hypothetical protein